MSNIDQNVLHKEIDLIQSCISRMANNSFLIKGWAISLIAVVLALGEKYASSIVLCGIMLIPLISFWWLDVFFLRTERMYREMYKWVLVNRAKGNEELLYDLNPRRFAGKVDSRAKIMRSETLGWFYGVPVLIITVIIIFEAVPVVKGWISIENNEVIQSYHSRLIPSVSSTNSVPGNFDREKSEKPE